MVQSIKCIEALQRSVDARRAKKAHRLFKYKDAPLSVKRKYLYKDEVINMTKDKDYYEDYILRYLNIETGERPDESQTKIAVAMYKEKAKEINLTPQSEVEELDMEAFKKHATENDEPDEPTTET